MAFGRVRAASANAALYTSVLPLAVPGGDHEVASVPEHRQSVRLMRVQAADARQAQPRDQQVGQAVGEGFDRGRARRQMLHMDQ